MSKQQNKKRKLEHSSQLTDPEDIRKSFRAQNPDVVVKGRVTQVSSLSNILSALNQLRNQVAIGFEEEKITAQDERLLLVQQWLEGNQGAQDIFGLWEHADPVCILFFSARKKDDIRQRGKLTSFDLLTGNTKFSPAFSEKWGKKNRHRPPLHRKPKPRSIQILGYIQLLRW